MDDEHKIEPEFTITVHKGSQIYTLGTGDGNTTRFSNETIKDILDLLHSKKIVPTPIILQPNIDINSPITRNIKLTIINNSQSRQRSIQHASRGVPQLATSYQHSSREDQASHDFYEHANALSMRLPKEMVELGRNGKDKVFDSGVIIRDENEKVIVLVE